MDDQEQPGWGEEDWDDEVVRADLLRLLTTADGVTDEATVTRREKRIRKWAAVEYARLRARGPEDHTETSPAGETNARRDTP